MQCNSFDVVMLVTFPDPSVTGYGQVHLDPNPDNAVAGQVAWGNYRHLATRFAQDTGSFLFKIFETVAVFFTPFDRTCGW